MSANSDFEQSAVGKFVKEINLPALLLQSKESKRIDMDWRGVLTRLKDGQGEIWQGQFQEPYIESFGHGYLRGNLVSGNKKVGITVTSFLMNDWAGRLDYVVMHLTLTSRMSINAKLIPSSADVYFGPKDTPDSPFCFFILDNFYVELSAYDEDSVSALAQAILDEMHKHSRKISAPVPKKFTVSPGKHQGLVNQDFSLVVSGLVSDWIVKQPNAVLPKGLIDTGGDKNMFTFKAVKAGKMLIPFVAMNKHSLLLREELIEVVIQ